MPKLSLITLEHPCTACIIIDGILKEVMQKVKVSVPDLETEIIILKHPRDLYEIEGVEIEKFPILMLDDEQISAGSFMTAKQIINLLP